MSLLLQDAIASFINARRAENVSDKTIVWYKGKLSGFGRAVGKVELTSVTPDMIRTYLIALQTRNVRYPGQDRQTTGRLSDHTVLGHDRMLRTFFNWCALEYDLNPALNPMRKIRKPKVGEIQPKAMTIDDLISLIAVCGETPIGLRNRAILLFLGDTGCRAGGLVGLRNTDLDLDRRRAIVTEKGNRQRTIFLTPFTTEALRKWLAVRPPLTEAVFCSLSPRTTGEPLHIESLHRILKRLAIEAGITGRCNPHSLRHMFAMLNLEAGNDLLTVSQLLGHRDLKTTEHYIHWTDGQRASRHDQYSPINELLERLRL